MLGVLAKERTIAEPDFNRWMVPPAVGIPLLWGILKTV